MIDEAVAAIDSLEVEVARLQADLDVQRQYEAKALAEQQQYYVELLALKDTRIVELEDAVKAASGGKTKAFLENVLWALGGYGVRAATDR